MTCIPDKDLFVTSIGNNGKAIRIFKYLGRRSTKLEFVHYIVHTKNVNQHKSEKKVNFGYK